MTISVYNLVYPKQKVLFKPMFGTLKRMQCFFFFFFFFFLFFCFFHVSSLIFILNK